MMTFIVFEDPKSMEHIIESGTDVTVPSRPVDKPNHEISLEDVERLVPSGPLTSSISPELEEVPPADPENDSSVLGFRIYPASMSFIYLCWTSLLKSIKLAKHRSSSREKLQA
jgi:hypothetical protein